MLAATGAAAKTQEGRGRGLKPTRRRNVLFRSGPSERKRLDWERRHLEVHGRFVDGTILPDETEAAIVHRLGTYTVAEVRLGLHLGRLSPSMLPSSRSRDRRRRQVGTIPGPRPTRHVPLSPQARIFVLSQTLLPNRMPDLWGATGDHRGE